MRKWSWSSSFSNTTSKRSGKVFREFKVELYCLNNIQIL